MGNFVKESLDPANILASLFVIGSTAVAGPAGFAASSAAVLGASQSIKAAGASEVELELDKRQEKLGFKDREVARQRRLATILGTQRAEAAASGIGQSGSVASISIADAEQAATDRIVDRSNVSGTIQRLTRQQKSIRRAGVLSAAGRVLGTGAAILDSGVKIEKGRTTPAGKASKNG